MMGIPSQKLTQKEPNRSISSYYHVLAPLFIVVLLTGFSGGLILSQPVLAQTNDTEGQATETIHVVQPGDTITAIARRYGVSVSALMRQNGVTDANFIYVGQRLTIPDAPTATPAPTTAEQTTTPETAVTVSVTPTAPEPTATATAKPVPTQVLTTIYTVQAGDTLSAIARRFDTTVSDLLRRNAMANANYVYVGQRLKVPVPAKEGATGDTSGSEEKPIRINFAAGTTVASVEGLLTFPQQRCYVLDAFAGQEMSVALASGGDLANFYVKAANHAVNGGVPVKRLENEDRTWQYLLPASGDYIVCVALPEGAAAYTLTVSIPVSCTSVTQEIEVVDWAEALSKDPALSHETIGDDDFVTVLTSTTTISGIPQLNEIVYGDFDGDCLEEAGIPLFSGGTAGNVGFLVYDILEEDETTGTAPTLVAWGEGYKLLLLADSGLLIVSNALYSGWEPNCCPSGVSYEGYRLRDGQLVLVSSDSEGFAEMRTETVTHFYTLLQNKSYTDAYDLLSPEFQAANPFDAWQAGYANTESFAATVTADTDIANRVTVALAVNERLSNGATRVRHYNGYWDLRWNGAAPGWILQNGQFVVVP